MARGGIKAQRTSQTYFSSESMNDICDPYVILSLVVYTIDKRDQLLRRGGVETRDGIIASCSLYRIHVGVALAPMRHIHAKEPCPCSCEAMALEVANIRKCRYGSTAVPSRGSLQKPGASQDRCYSGQLGMFKVRARETLRPARMDAHLMVGRTPRQRSMATKLSNNVESTRVEWCWQGRLQIHDDLDACHPSLCINPND